MRDCSLHFCLGDIQQTKDQTAYPLECSPSLVMIADWSKLGLALSLEVPLGQVRVSWALDKIVGQLVTRGERPSD